MIFKISSTCFRQTFAHLEEHKTVELILEINKLLLLHFVGFLYYFTYNFYHSAMHLDIIKVFYLPTDSLYISLRKH